MGSMPVSLNFVTRARKRPGGLKPGSQDGTKHACWAGSADVFAADAGAIRAGMLEERIRRRAAWCRERRVA